ncbi:hypothetical protein [Mycobacterium phage Weirdo19]|uniref:Uncharacterized protein n=1 Tax=Mycobacterium phage Weirdo19 TaxID=2601610 RepID=A0A6M2YSW2_9CAUD|nr:hypothetical protein KDJ11_gp85 [Mycobacterium phage Weirdo19]QEA10853.1 hypothetical protein [Mycobacterium phage Weirdo19]
MPSLPRFVDADEPATYMSGTGLVLKAEFSHTITVTCAACKNTRLRLKLLADTVLTTASCNALLTAHLDRLGWSRLRDGGADICPECAGTHVEVCEQCRQYGGGHARSCPTQRPRGLNP